MPESIIKRVKQFDKSNTRPNTLDFVNRNGILFEWDNKVMKYPKGLIEEEVVIYPSLAAEIPRLVLEQDQPIPTIECTLM